MNDLASRLHNARTELHLSQEYVAQQLNISRASVSQIEIGKRKVTSDELAQFSKLYRISTDELLYGRRVELPSQVFARAFQDLEEADQQEILNLMEFKRMMRERRS